MTEEKFELALERLHATKTGRHRAAVILSHGFFVNSLLWNLDEDHSLERYLAQEGFDVWNLSLRGAGRSLKPLKGAPQSWSLDDMIEKDLPAVIRYVQNESAGSTIIWVGFEMGGLLGYGYSARKAGSGLAGLVSVGTPVTFTHPQQEPLKILLRLEESPTLKKIFLSLNGPFLGRILIPLLRRIEDLFYNRDNIEDEVKAKLLEQALVEINPGVLDQLILMVKRGEFVSAKGDFSYRKNLAKVQLPLLLIGGESDALAPPEAIQTVHRAVGSTDRSMRIFGRRSKDSAAYGHMDLMLGPKARQEVFPVIAAWLKQRGARE